MRRKYILFVGSPKHPEVVVTDAGVPALGVEHLQGALVEQVPFWTQMGQILGFSWGDCLYLMSRVESVQLPSGLRVELVSDCIQKEDPEPETAMDRRMVSHARFPGNRVRIRAGGAS